MPTLMTIAKHTIPWVRRVALAYDAWQVMQKRQELNDQLATLPAGKAKAKVLRELADLEIELEKIAGKMK